eukprot:PhF_6_TR38324/c0_g1_i1/m.57147
MFQSDVSRRNLICFLTLMVTGWLCDKAANAANNKSKTTGHHCNITEENYRGMAVDLMVDAMSVWKMDQWGLAMEVPDIFLTVVSSTSFLLLMKSSVSTMSFSLSSSRFCRFWNIFQWLLLYRGLTNSVTGYVPISKKCVDLDTPFRWWGNSFFFVLPTCGDYMYSGHTALFTLSFLFQWWYRPVLHITGSASTHKVWLTLYALACICGIFSLWGARYHYTTDVLLSLYITSSSFIIYHLLILPYFAMIFHRRQRAASDNSSQGGGDSLSPLYMKLNHLQNTSMHQIPTSQDEDEDGLNRITLIRKVLDFCLWFEKDEIQYLLERARLNG